MSKRSIVVAPGRKNKRQWLGFSAGGVKVLSQVGVYRRRDGKMSGTTWRCVLACGCEATLTSIALRRIEREGNQQKKCWDCEVKKRKSGGAHNREDLTGQQFYEYTVVKRLPNYQNKYTVYLCRCSCGQERPVRGTNLTQGLCKSCGHDEPAKRSRRAIERLNNDERFGKRQWEYRGKCGTVFMRSSWEVAVAHYFDSQGIEWKYEPRRISLDKSTIYMPDFYLPESDAFVEVKGMRYSKGMDKVAKYRDMGGKVIVMGREIVEAMAGMKARSIQYKYKKKVA